MHSFVSCLVQVGYGAFSIGISGVDDTIAYIDNQAEHHKRLSFKEELQNHPEKTRNRVRRLDARLITLSPLAGAFGFAGLSTHC